MKRGQVYLVLVLMVLCATLTLTPHTDAAVVEEFRVDTNGYLIHTVKIDIPAGTWTIVAPTGVKTDDPNIFSFDKYPTLSFEETYLDGIIYEYTVPLDGRVRINPTCDDSMIKWTPDGDWSYGDTPHMTEGSKVQVLLFPDYSTETDEIVLENGLNYTHMNFHYPAQQLEIQATIYPDEEITTPPTPPEKEVTLAVNINKDKLTTGEEVVVSGSVKHNGSPIPSSSVQVELFQNGIPILVAPDVPVNPDGSYTYRWKLESTATEPPTGPEAWTARVTSKTPAEYTDKTVDKNFQVLQLWIEVINAKVIQITEAPYNMDKYAYALGADKQAGIRVYYHWKGAVQGFNLPQIPSKIEFKTSSGSTTATTFIKIDQNTVISDFIFTLPEGQYPVTINLDPDNHFLSTANPERTWNNELFSKEMKEVNLVFQPIDMPSDWINSGNQQRFLAWIKKQTDFIKQVYPIPAHKFSYSIIQDTITPAEELHDKTWITQQLQSMNWLGNMGRIGRTLETKISSMTEDAHLQLKKTIVLRQLSKFQRYTESVTVGVLPSNTRWWTVGEGGMTNAKLFANTVLVKENADMFVTAHEVGHTFGLYLWGEQYYAGRDFGIEVNSLILKEGKIYDLSYPHVPATGATPKAQLSDKQRAFTFNTKHVYCFMGAGIQFPYEPWASFEASKELFQSLMDPPQRCLYVSGVVFENYTAVDLWYTTYGEPHIRISGDYTISCLDTNGNTLNEACFGNYTQISPFGFNIPYPEETETIEIRYNGDVLGSVTATQSAPVLSDLVITGQGNKQYSATWNSNDNDGDNITHTLYYSPDNGENWICVSPDTREPEYNINLEGQPGGTTCLIKVYASDGLNTGEVTSTPFSVEASAPIAAIFTPLNNITYPEGLQTLEGLVYDLEDGVIDTPVWTSSIDGSLGTGSTIETSLSLGEHLLTLTGVDSDGNSVESQTTVMVASQVCTVTEHILCSEVSNGSPIYRDDVFEPSSQVISYLTLTNATTGDTVTWRFTGPNGLSYEDSMVLDFEGDVYAYSPLDLSQFSPELNQGQWTVTVSVNGVEASTAYFTVEEILTGLVWWAPFVGALILLTIGALVLRRIKKPKQAPCKGVLPNVWRSSHVD